MSTAENLHQLAKEMRELEIIKTEGKGELEYIVEMSLKLINQIADLLDKAADELELPK